MIPFSLFLIFCLVYFSFLDRYSPNHYTSFGLLQPFSLFQIFALTYS